MAPSQNTRKSTQKKAVEKKAPAKKAPEKQVAPKAIQKKSVASRARGQPTGAARLINSPYVNYGWHKALTGATKETVQKVSSLADSMYMLQVEGQRPVDSLSLRNGIFWEHRQLVDPSIVSTPALDHLDLFPACDNAFSETMQKIGRKYAEGNKIFLHYIFKNMREREFLILPVEIDGCWVTIIAKIRLRRHMSEKNEVKAYADQELAELAIVDPLLLNSRHRRELILRRLNQILPEGCIEPTKVVIRKYIRIPIIPLQEAEDGPDDRWKTGLIAYAVCCEFMRRLKTLQWRRGDKGARPGEDQDFLWAEIEGAYNFEYFRQNLMAACAHQCIERSEYTVRMALEVPSGDPNYQPATFTPANPVRDFPDEKWDAFDPQTHTVSIHVPQPRRQRSTPPSAGSFRTPQYQTPASAKESPQVSPTSHGNTPQKAESEEEEEEEYEGDTSGDTSGGSYEFDPYGPVPEYEQGAAHWGGDATGFMGQVPGLDLLGEVRAPGEDVSYLQVCDPGLVAATPTGGLSPVNEGIVEGTLDGMTLEGTGAKRSFAEYEVDEAVDEVERAMKRQLTVATD